MIKNGPMALRIVPVIAPLIAPIIVGAFTLPFTTLPFTTQAHAHTLREAIEIAWETSPALAEARFRREAEQEALPQARADGRPTVSLQSRMGYDALSGGNGATGSSELTAALPIWSGGRVRSAIRVADAKVAAAQQRLRDREAAVIDMVVTAYAELLFAQESLKVTEVGIARLDRQIEEAQSRFKLGESTLTDVAQLQTQRSRVIANLADGKAALAAARAAYLEVVGAEPDRLTMPAASLQSLPENLQTAREYSLQNNPQLLEQRPPPPI